MAKDGGGDDLSPGPWNVCVLVRSAEHGGFEFVSSARQALARLADRWPVRESAYRHAVATCGDVLKSWSPSYLARIAFEDAVREAGLSW